MEKYLKYFVLMLATVLSLSLSSCGGDGEDEPDQPNKPSGKYEVVSKTIGVGSRIIIQFTGQDGFQYDFCKIGLYNNEYKSITFSAELSTSDRWHVQAHNIRYAAYGNVNSLASINSVNGLDWTSSSLIVEDKGGVVIEGTFEGQTYYIRLFIDSLNRNASGDVIGFNLKWQQFTPAQ